MTAGLRFSGPGDLKHFSQEFIYTQGMRTYMYKLTYVVSVNLQNGDRKWAGVTAVSHHINYGNLVLVWEPGTFSEAYHMGRSVGFFSAYTESMQN